MAVIVTGMGIPKNCASCDLTYLDTGDDAYFGTNEHRCVVDDSVIDCNTSEREYDCPLKSIDGLIEKIETDMSHYMYDDYGNTTTEHDVLVGIIKEYCGLEKSNGNSY